MVITSDRAKVAPQNANTIHNRKIPKGFPQKRSCEIALVVSVTESVTILKPQRTTEYEPAGSKRVKNAGELKLIAKIEYQ